MPTTPTGVLPVYHNKFKVAATGTTATTTIAEMESFSVSIDGSIEEWTSMENEGWGTHLLTGKKLTISLSGKRCIGDTGNDFIAGLAWKTGKDCDVPFEWEFPSGGKLSFCATINVKTPGGGDSTNAEKLEFDVLCNGKPTYTAPVSAG